MKTMIRVLRFMLVMTLMMDVSWGQWESILPKEYRTWYDGIFVFNKDTAIVVGGDGVIARTTDGGAHWVQIAAGTVPPLHSVWFVDADTGYAAGDGILKSTDGGASWKEQISWWGLWSICFINKTNGFAVGYDGVILRTTNGGLTWGIHSQWSSYTLQRIIFLNSLTGFVVGKNLILKTTNAGETWSVMYTPASWPCSVHFPCDSTGYVTTIEGTILKTINGGRTWQQLAYNSPFRFGDIHFMDDSLGFAVSYGEIIKTTNGGSTWQQVYSATNKSITSLHFFDHKIGFVIGQDCTILKTTDGGNNWNLQSQCAPNSNYNSIVFVDGGTGTCVGDGGTLLRTSDGGINWDQQTSPPNVNLQMVVYSDKSNGSIVGDNGTILRTRDGGNTWSPVSITTTANLLAIQSPNGKANYVIGSEGTFIRTNNGGSNWIIDKIDSIEFSRALSFLDEKHGFAAGQVVGDFKTATILSTQDSGRTWSRICDIPNFFSSTLQMMNSSVGFIVGGRSNYNDYPRSGIVLKTADGGNTWQNKLEFSYAEFHTLWFADTLHGYVAGQDGIIFKTNDGGNHWEYEHSKLGVDIRSLVFSTTGDGFAAGSGGTLLRLHTNPATQLGDATIGSTISSYLLHQNYPNPFNPTTLISYQLPVNSYVTLKVYDLLGREVATLVNERKEAGKYSVRWNASGFATGVYLVRIQAHQTNGGQAGSFIDTKKVLLMR